MAAAEKQVNHCKNTALIEAKKKVSTKRINQTEAIQKRNEEDAYLFFTQALCNLPDPRRSQGTWYPLKTVVITALMAMICGADDAEAMELWGEQHQNWLKNILEMPHGPPKQDVYLRVFAGLDPKAMSGVLQAWAEMISLPLKGQKRQISVDGKTSRRIAPAKPNVQNRYSNFS